jgi:hypothetical protein
MSESPSGYRCPSCGRWCEEAPRCWNLPLPDHVAEIPEALRGSRVEHVVQDELLVRDGKDFFIRGNLDLPILPDKEDCLRITCWMSLSEQNALRQVDHWLTDGRERKLEPMVGYLCNEIPEFPGSFLHVVRIHTKPVGTRPLMELQPGDHPLARAQREGVPMSLVLHLAHTFGHGD